MVGPRSPVLMGIPMGVMVLGKISKNFMRTRVVFLKLKGLVEILIFLVSNQFFCEIVGIRTNSVPR